MKHGIIILCILSAALFSKGTDGIAGYKNLRWGMAPDEVGRLFLATNAAAKDAVYGKSWGSVVIANSTVCDKYLDDFRQVVIGAFYFKNRLYRIDIANYAGQMYEDLNFSSPISLQQKDKLIQSFRDLYGDPDRNDKPFFVYDKIMYYDSLAWWTGDTVSVSLLTREVPIIKKTYSYRISYYHEPVLKEIGSYRNETDIAKLLDLK
ncbi:MAG: hypothetical protein HZC28_16025 [Spirochaetes bacterium]|nr:hypothetical protein [Spirochaetota bacterium]